jgi:hypothetical protein
MCGLSKFLPLLPVEKIVDRFFQFLGESEQFPLANRPAALLTLLNHSISERSASATTRGIFFRGGRLILGAPQAFHNLSLTRSD